MSVFNLQKPADGTKELPIIISSPHSGESVPAEMRACFRDDLQNRLQDTDWFIDRLYDFAPAMGITLLSARYHRYVVDLNRDPDDVNLYDDGRFITGLFPEHSFDKQEIYSKEYSFNRDERLAQYYHPYHQALRDELARLRASFPQVLLFEAHSIRHHVPSLHQKPFPDFIFGNQDGKTCAPSLIQAACAGMREVPNAQVSENFPFKGGYITRAYGNPDKGTHSLQLEMSQKMYMDEDSVRYLPERADVVRASLQNMFMNLGEKLEELAV